MFHPHPSTSVSTSYLIYSAALVDKNSFRTPSEMPHNNPHAVPLHESSCDYQPPKDICKTPSSTIKDAVNRHQASLFLSQPPRTLRKIQKTSNYADTGFIGTMPSSCGMISSILGSRVQLFRSATVLSNKGVMRVQPASMSQ